MATIVFLLPASFLIPLFLVTNSDSPAWWQACGPAWPITILYLSLATVTGPRKSQSESFPETDLQGNLGGSVG